MPKTKFACWTRAQHQRSDTSGSSEQHLHNRDERCEQMKEGRLKQQQWLTWMKLTNKGDIDCRLQLLPSFPPSLLFDPVDVKAGSSTKHPVWRGRKHHVVFFFFFPLESRLMLFFVRHSTWKFNMLRKLSVVTLLYSAAGLEPAILQKCKWINNKAQRGALPLKSLTKHVKHRDKVSEKHY